jgi:hypothetical protein
VLFCLFAEDTGIFHRNAFVELISQRTGVDGSDLGPWLTTLFQVLNTPPNRRQRSLDEQLAEFPYVNGRLFDEVLLIPAFNASMRAALLEASALDWSRISPAIFGSMFQSVMDAKARRNLGAHYTSEKNILKLIGPLFLDDLKAELERIGNNTQKLKNFHVKLAKLRFLDPACGCGNFLVIAYRELRLVELELLTRLYAVQDSLLTRVSEHVAVDVDQFYGIEIEEFPAQIAQVALWLMDHQMNIRVGERFGEYFARLPLVKSATIAHGNSLRIDWNTVVPKERLSYILGNPPFGGKHIQSKSQRDDQISVMGQIKSGSDLDFVANWFVRSAEFTRGTAIDFAFVSTNSITQGEQVPLLWPHLLEREGLNITFAHRTFRWSNEARSNAAVHCIIVGLSRATVRSKRLFEYADPRSDPSELSVAAISPYLAPGGAVIVRKRTSAISPRPAMRCGSKPSDDGNLILSEDERTQLIAEFPMTEKWIRPFIGSDEFLNGGARWCLWLEGVDPSELRRVSPIMERVDKVRAFRAASTAAPTRAAALTPARFFFVAQPRSEYILVPEVSSERRRYVPIGWMSPTIVSSNKNYLIAEPSLHMFGVLQSAMHMAWLSTVGGRLKSDFQYSATMVYNTFPLPEPLDERARSAIETAAQGVLDARAAFPNSTLADLYDPLSMPPLLVKAHQHLDRSVDAAYVAVEKSAGRKSPKLGTAAERVAFLFERYQALASLLSAAEPQRGARRTIPQA